MSNTDDWGFEEGTVFDGKAYDASLKRYRSPISKHDCEKFGCKGRYASANEHDYQEVFDDFKLSQKAREDCFMEIVRSRGRTNREMILIRMYVSAIDGKTYFIRLQSSTDLTVTRYGEIQFDNREDCETYYNYCIELFDFSRSLMVVDEDEGQDFFTDLDEGKGDFFEDLETGSFFDDLEEANDWDIDEDDGELSW